MHNLTTQERKTIFADINHNLLTGGLTLGQAARQIRTELYQMSQTQYAAFCRIYWPICKDPSRYRKG